jgi:hypothetical protein
MASPEDLRQQLAESEARAAAARARADELAEELRILRLERQQPPAAPSPAPASPPPVSISHKRVQDLLDRNRVVVASPSKPETVSLPPSLASLDLSRAPLSPDLVRFDTTQSLLEWYAGGEDSMLLLHESSALQKALKHLPPWIVDTSDGGQRSGSVTAKTLFGVSNLPGMNLPWGCFPELPTRTAKPFHPSFNGEFKSAMSSGDRGGKLKMMDELLTYSMMGMVGSYFSGIPRGHHRFFTAPPYAFALAAFPHVGYLVVVEWVGKLLATVASQPFFLGSPEHKAAVERVPDRDFSHDVLDVPVEDVGVSCWPDEAEARPGSSPPRPTVIWRTEPPPAGATADVAAAGWRSSLQHAFFKLLLCDGFDAAYLRRVHEVYTRLAAARGDTADPPPAAVTDVQLLYGACELCVLMPWVHGRDARLGDLEPGGCAVAPVAEAIAWLGRHGLLYVDVREPNVRVADAVVAAATEAKPATPPPPLPAAPQLRVALVDYDDMVAVARPPSTVDELMGMLEAHHAAFVLPEGAAGARPALVAALRDAWARGAVSAPGS